MSFPNTNELSPRPLDCSMVFLCLLALTEEEDEPESKAGVLEAPRVAPR